MNPPIMRIDGQWTWATGGPPPRTHRYAYRLFDRDQDIWAWSGLHLVLRAANWYRSHRWALERWGHRRRWMYKQGWRSSLPWFVFVCKQNENFRNGHWVLRYK